MMSYLLVLLTILFTVYGQIAIKWQVLQAGALPHDPSAKFVFVLRLLLNPWVISALFAALLAAVCWIGAMTRLELSKAYPFMALNFILVAIFANLFFGEAITWPKVAGLTLVVIGLIVGGMA
ncbi:MAG: EamA family transporter [Rhodanobacteraceae bacterium]